MKDRLTELKTILQTGVASSQFEIGEELKRRGVEATQSTISRSLRKIGAVKVVDDSGTARYKLAVTETDPLSREVQASLSDLVRDIVTNGMQIVIHTSVGSASLVARHLDVKRPEGIIGTIAGDDTVFVAPRSSQAIPATLHAIKESLLAQENR